MTNKELEKKLCSAFEDATPDVLGSVLADCRKEQKPMIVFKSSVSNWNKKFAISAVAAILVICLSVGWAGLGGIDPTDPTDPFQTGTQPTDTQPTEPRPTDPQPTEPRPTDPQPTEPEPTDPQPTEPEPTEPESTDPVEPTKPTEPQPGDGGETMSFPEDMITDADMIAKFQELFSCKHPEDNFFNMALLSVYADPRDADLVDLFYNGFYGLDNHPNTAEEAAALKELGVNLEYDIVRCPADKMDEVLTQLFGLTLADFNEDALKGFVYLESTDCYYLNLSDGNCAHDLQIAGIRNLKNGNIEVYYSWSSWTDLNGVITLKPNGDGYHIISNIYARAPK